MVVVYPTLKFCSAVCVTVVGVNTWSGDHSSAKLQENFFRIGHLGSLTDVMALFGIATSEMALVDLSFTVSLGS